MSEDLRSKLNRLTVILEEHEQGQPLPIQLKDIFFIFGACSRLLTNIDKLEETYKNDMEVACSEVDRFRTRWKEARRLCVKQDNRIMIYRQLADVCENLSWWRQSKEIKDILAQLEKAKKKFNEDKENLSALSKDESNLKVYSGHHRHDQEDGPGGRC